MKNDAGRAEETPATAPENIWNGKDVCRQSPRVNTAELRQNVLMVSVVLRKNLAAAIDYKCGYYLNKSSLMAYHCSDVSCICRTRRYQKKTTLDLLRKHWISSVLSIKQVKDVIFKGDTATHVTKGLKDRCKLKLFLAKWQQKHSVSALDVCYQKVSVWPCDKLVTCSGCKLSLTPTWLK